MKTLLTLLLCLILTATQSQELQSLQLLPPESKELNDLSFLKDELKGKQMVMLGEMTHMYGNIFEMKARLIEYLHQELGFTTIAMESSMYDIWKMNLNGFDKKTFNSSIWGVWSGSIEFQRLVDYIDDNNIKVIGFDSQVNATAQFVEDFFNYCEEKNITFKLDEDDLGIIIEGVLETVTIEEEDIKYSVYEKELKRIIGIIEKLENNDTNYHWTQFTKSLLACSQDAYYNRVEINSTDFGNKNHNIRDRQMADNLLSYTHRNPSEKIVVWADNIHVINDQSSIQKPIQKDFVSMGTFVKKDLKAKVYSLATLHANDSLINLRTREWHATPIEDNSFEAILNTLNTPFLFVTSNQEAMQSTKRTRLLDFVDFTEARVDQLFDGYLFFQNATLPKHESESTTISSQQKDLGKKIEQIELGQNVVLKGQIIDGDNQEPIPFATLILKKEEIYRVADENGFYELPIKKLMMESAIVNISSMGFESVTVSLKELTKKTTLKPKFEVLSEVVVTGYLSPKAVLKKAISNKKTNHPVEPFNFQRYGNVLINVDDTNQLDLEVITKDYDAGYLSPFVITQRVEQIKWNENKNPKNYKYVSQFFTFRQNAIRYANILHKRKYKKFKLTFVKSNDPIDDGLHIISFETERNKWSYTNKGYPTAYSGRVYIDKENFAIVKVVENWETTLNKDEIDKHFKDYKSYDNIIQTTIKEENICEYKDVLGNKKYYATTYSNHSYREKLNKENKMVNSMTLLDSYLFDFEVKNVEEIPFEFRKRDQTVLSRVAYDEVFWESFYERQIGLTLE